MLIADRCDFHYSIFPCQGIERGMNIPKNLTNEIARRATAIYFDIGIHPSLLECLGQPGFDGSPAGRMLGAIIQACEDIQDVLDSEHNGFTNLQPGND